MWQVSSSHSVEEDAGLPDLSRQNERERLSQAAIDGFFAIMDKWNIPMDTAADLLGGVPRSSFYKLKNAAGTLKQDELMRISCIAGIYQALHSLLPAEFADQWMSRPNDHPLFAGRTPAEHAVRAGIPGLLQIRNMLDAETSGH
jgi:uncharacterized protein (DUF2384 family)